MGTPYDTFHFWCGSYYEESLEGLIQQIRWFQVYFDIAFYSYGWLLCCVWREKYAATPPPTLRFLINLYCSGDLETIFMLHRLHCVQNAPGALLLTYPNFDPSMDK